MSKKDVRRNQRTPIPSSTQPLHSDREDGKNYTEKKNNTILVHDTNEETKTLRTLPRKNAPLNRLTSKDTSLLTTSQEKSVERGGGNSVKDNQTTSDTRPFVYMMNLLPPSLYLVYDHVYSPMTNLLKRIFHKSVT